MKILSYKILSESTANLFNQNASALGGSISRNLLKTTRMSKERGIEGANDTLKLFTRFIQLKFNFYDANANPALNTDLNVAFGIYFTGGGLVAHLMPYYSESIQSLIGRRLQYATLQLFDPSNNNQPIDIEDLFNNFQQGGRYNFLLTIPNEDVFREINNQYGFANLNQLADVRFANTVIPNPDYTIGLNQSSGFRRITNDGNQESETYTNISFQIQGQQLTPEQTELNRIFLNPVNCTILFNNGRRPAGMNALPQGMRYITSIQYNNNSFVYLFTQNPINPSNRVPIPVNNCNIQTANIPNATITPPLGCNLRITSIS